MRYPYPGGLGEFPSSSFVVSPTGIVTASASSDALNSDAAKAAVLSLQRSINRWSSIGFSKLGVDGAIGPATVSAARKVIAYLAERFPGAALPANRSPDAAYLAMFSVEFSATFDRYSPPQGVPLVQNPTGPGYSAGVSGSVSSLPLIVGGAALVYFLTQGKGKKRRKGRKKGGKRRRR